MNLKFFIISMFFFSASSAFAQDSIYGVYGARGVQRCMTAVFPLWEGTDALISVASAGCSPSSNRVFTQSESDLNHYSSVASVDSQAGEFTVVFENGTITFFRNGERLTSKEIIK